MAEREVAEETRASILVCIFNTHYTWEAVKSFGQSRRAGPVSGETDATREGTEYNIHTFFKWRVRYLNRSW
jgi:hypothetical protein